MAISVSDSAAQKLLAQILNVVTQAQQDGNQSKLYLEYIAQSIRQTNQLLQSILEIETSNNGYLSQIELNTATLIFPQSFIVKETTMALQQPDPGATLQYTATLNPAGSSLGSVVPVWATSDSANITITTDAAGLVATLVLSTSIPVGEVVSGTVSATDPATGHVATGTFGFTVGAPPPSFPTSFTVAQTA